MGCLISKGQQKMFGGLHRITFMPTS